MSVDLSWLLILVLLTASFAEGFPQILHSYFPSDTRKLGPANFWLMGLITALAFFICVVLHEFGHALVGRAHGMPINGITLFLFGGVSELGDEPKCAVDEFLMAIAGPLVSGVLSVAFWIIAEVGYHSRWPHAVVIVLGYLAFINLIVLIFNMIPAFPLDGGRVLRSILWGATGNVRRSTRWASYIGQAFGWFLIISGVLTALLNPTYFFNGLWSVLIGIFLNSAARSGYQQMLIKQLLQGEPIRRFMNADPIVVSPSLDLLHWVEDYVYRYHHKTFPVATEGRLEGIVSTQALSRVPRSEWAEHTIKEVQFEDIGAVSIAAQADAMQALTKMQKSGSSMLLVTEGEHLIGIISLKDLYRFLNTKLEVEGRDDGYDNRDYGRKDHDRSRYKG